MSLDIVMVGGQLLMAAVGSMLWYSVTKNSEKVDKLSIEVGTLKEIVTTVRSDHDSLILLCQRTTENEKDINHAHEKIRALM